MNIVNFLIFLIFIKPKPSYLSFEGLTIFHITIIFLIN